MTKKLSSSLENMMNLTRILPSIAGAALACAVLAAPAANAQTTTSSSLAVNSSIAAKTVTTPTSSTTLEALSASGTLGFSATAIVDPAGGPTTVVYYADGLGDGSTATPVRITGASGTYAHTLQASITRPLTVSGADTLVFTIPAISPSGQARTLQVTAKVQMNTTTLQLTSATISLASF